MAWIGKETHSERVSPRGSPRLKSFPDLGAILKTYHENNMLCGPWSDDDEPMPVIGALRASANYRKRADKMCHCDEKSRVPGFGLDNTPRVAISLDKAVPKGHEEML
jgi:hypothetical protein